MPGDVPGTPSSGNHVFFYGHNLVWVWIESSRKLILFRLLEKYNVPYLNVWFFRMSFFVHILLTLLLTLGITTLAWSCILTGGRFGVVGIPLLTTRLNNNCLGVTCVVVCGVVRSFSKNFGSSFCQTCP